MPNDFGNTVTIIGHKQDLDLFEDHQLSFSHFYPCPIQEEVVDWCYENWGTKWDPYDLTIKRGGEMEIRFDFCTANGPPIAFLKNLLVQYPRCWIKLEFSEVMMMIAGVWVGYMKNGILKEKYMDWTEPMACLTADGELLVEIEDDDN